MANQPARRPHVPDPKGCAIHVQSEVNGVHFCSAQASSSGRWSTEAQQRKESAPGPFARCGICSPHAPLGQHLGPSPGPRAPGIWVGGVPGAAFQGGGSESRVLPRPSPESRVALPPRECRVAACRPGLVCGEERAQGVGISARRLGLLSLETASPSYNPGLALETVTHKVTPVAQHFHTWAVQDLPESGADPPRPRDLGPEGDRAGKSSRGWPAANSGLGPAALPYLVAERGEGSLGPGGV